MLSLSNFENKKGYIVLARIGRFFTKLVWIITVLFVVLAGIKVFIYRYNHPSEQQSKNQGLDVKSGEAFKKQFQELEKFTEEREKAKKQKKQPTELKKPEANNSTKEKNMLLKKFDEKYNFDGA
jgi:hypothetical protein